MKFTKMHGIGNDYIYFNCFEEKVYEPEKLAVKLSDRRFGIGGDGIVLIMPSDKADFKMRIFNADGSEGKMCGNATRCIGKYVYERGLTDKTKITLETLSGIKTINLTVVDRVVESISVDMGKAILEAEKIPVIADTYTVIGRNMTVAGKEQKITCVSTGNPHCVVFTEKIDKLNLEKIGPKYENDPIFPDRINTEFVEVIDSNTLKMRVWERGSGETLACGTGACAVTVAAVENGFCSHNQDIKVILRGGELIIKYMGNGTIIMTGPAAFVFDGEFSL